jgi:hypothetical protein
MGFQDIRSRKDLERGRGIGRIREVERSSSRTGWGRDGGHS